jgi:hypothetical protein
MKEWKNLLDTQKVNTDKQTHNNQEINKLNVGFNEHNCKFVNDYSEFKLLHKHQCR